MLSATGEEDLLAYYLKQVNDQDEHDFIIPSKNSVLMIQEDMWRDFSRSNARKAQLEADSVSYLWDELIESFTYHFMTATSRHGSSTTYQDHEKILRFFAREPRLHRRMLSKALLEAVQMGKEGSRFTRYIKPSLPGDPYYVFLILEKSDFATYEQYWQVRANLLQAICNVVKLKFPDALDIVGFATEPGLTTAGRSEDAVYLDARRWSDEDRQQALEDQKKLEVLESPTETRRHENEYPISSTSQRVFTPYRIPRRSVSVRNSLCPCESGKKFKRCCGQRR